MAAKNQVSGQKERLHVAIRIRPMQPYKMGHKILKVLNKQTVVLTELPNYDKSDLEEHFRTGTTLYPTGIGSRFSTSNTRRHSHHHHKQNGFNFHNGSSLNIIKHQQFHFDHVFDEDATQEQVYATLVAPLVHSVLEGIHVTVFAYGSTSSGKTYSMIGTGENPGIMMRAVDDVFRACCDLQSEFHNVEVFISYIELYNEQIHDLLQPAHSGVHLELLDDKDQVHILGLSESKVVSTNEVLGLLHKGNRARVVEATSANEASSRSHAILVVTVRQRSLKSNESIEGKLYLIDLAGSERASITKNSGVRLREGAHINRSLLALGNCITALASGRDGGKYVNYRDSKLTRLLKNALGGPSRTAMIAHVHPIPKQLEETRNTLVYAQRARSISNSVYKINHSLADELSMDKNHNSTLIQDLQNQVEKLQVELQQLNTVKSQQEDEALRSESASPRNLQNVSTNTDAVIPPMHQNFIKNLDRPNLNILKEDISRGFEQECVLRNELLKVDGSMLQSAVDSEILRLVVLDWEHPTLKNESAREGEFSDNLGWNHGRSEMGYVMTELKKVQKEQHKILRRRAIVEEELKQVREKIVDQKEKALQYLPNVQQEILALICRLQHEQLQKMSLEIKTELKKRGRLVLRFIRQKTLGEAIIYTQRSLYNAITGTTDSGESDSAIEMEPLPLVLPLLKDTSSPKWSSNDNRVFSTPSPSSNSSRNSVSNHPFDSETHLPRLENNSYATTKYADFRSTSVADTRVGHSER